MTFATTRRYVLLLLSVILVIGSGVLVLLGKMTGTEAGAILTVTLPFLIGTHVAVNRPKGDE